MPAGTLLRKLCYGGPDKYDRWAGGGGRGQGSSFKNLEHNIKMKRIKMKLVHLIQDQRTECTIYTIEWTANDVTVNTLILSPPFSLHRRIPLTEDDINGVSVVLKNNVSLKKKNRIKTWCVFWRWHPRRHAAASEVPRGATTCFSWQGMGRLWREAEIQPVMWPVSFCSIVALELV